MRKYRQLHEITCAFYILTPRVPRYIYGKHYFWKPWNLPKILISDTFVISDVICAQSLLEDGHLSQVHRQGRISLCNGKHQELPTKYVPVGRPLGRPRRQKPSHLPLEPDRDRLVPKGRQPAGRLNNSNCTTQKRKTRIPTCSPPCQLSFKPVYAAWIHVVFEISFDAR